ncbi:TPA: hypothetical protein ACUA50_000875 [Escherichia coli]
MYGMCVKTGDESFTLFEDYQIDNLTVVSDTGDTWYLHDYGDGYVGCRSYEGKEYLFLIEGV